MAITVKHSKVSSIPDGADTSVVRPSDWNADHTLSGLGTMAEQSDTSVDINGGAIDGTTVGTASPSTGAFTTLSSSSTATLNGTTIPASKTLLVTTDIGSSVQAYDADLTTWGSKTAPSGTVVGTSDTQTLTNKTLTSPIITGTILEDVYTITDGAGFAIDPTNGSIQLITLGASRTPTAANWDAGEGVTLMVNDGTAYTITWTTIGVTWVGGSAPTLATSGYTVIELWKVGSTIYGALVGSVA